MDFKDSYFKNWYLDYFIICKLLLNKAGIIF
jgi:hypothetical protein